MGLNLVILIQLPARQPVARWCRGIHSADLSGVTSTSTAWLRAVRLRLTQRRNRMLSKTHSPSLTSLETTARSPSQRGQKAAAFWLIPGRAAGQGAERVTSVAKSLVKVACLLRAALTWRAMTSNHGTSILVNLWPTSKKTPMLPRCSVAMANSTSMRTETPKIRASLLNLLQSHTLVATQAFSRSHRGLRTQVSSTDPMPAQRRSAKCHRVRCSAPESESRTSPCGR